MQKVCNSWPVCITLIEKMNRTPSHNTTVLLVALSISLGGVLRAQTLGRIEGTVLDPSGAIVPRASVRASQEPRGPSRSVVTDAQGHFEISNLVPGRYKMTVAAPGFAPSIKENVVIVAGRPRTLEFHLVLATQRQNVQVGGRANRVAVAPQNNASAVVITGRSLNALSNDPDELASQLAALAGPAVGPSGGEIYINGFIGGDLPPKSDIREIKVNSNPFSVENDRFGYGRIDIFTKPGGEKYHGDLSSEYNGSGMNALSPFLAASAMKPPSYHTWLWGGDFGGPLGKKASFFLGFQRRNINRANLVNTDALNPSFAVVPYVATVTNPRALTNLNPRVDIGLNSKNTLSVNYDYYSINERNDGVDTQSLPSQAFDAARHHHNLQIFDNQVLSAHVVNEIRFQFLHFHDVDTPQSLEPTLDVLGAFTGGGSANGAINRRETHDELQDYATVSLANHLVEFGGFIRDISRLQDDTANFNGMFTFNSLADYQKTEQALANGMTVAEIQTAGYGPSQFNITTGNLSASVNRVDAALFLGDDWRIRPSFTASYGLRLETENVINRHAYWAPRFALAWGIGRGGNVKTVLRAGWGIFYERLDDDQMMVAARLNGTNQLTRVVNQPDFFPAPPPPSTLAGLATSIPTVYRIAPDLRLPYDMDTAVSLERQLLPSTTISLTYINSSGLHQFLTNDANAPLPGTFNPSDPASGIRPLGSAAGNIYQYESDAIYRQTQLIANVHVRANRLSLFGYYVFNDAHSDTAGIDSFAANPWNLMADYGRALFDVRNRAMIGGTFALPAGLRLSSVVMANSGIPFSILLPQDLYGTGIHNARPAPATASTPAADLVRTPYGDFNIAPSSTSAIIPPNAESGPANFMLNVRLSRTFGFGGEAKGSHGGRATAQRTSSSHYYHHRAGLGGRGMGGGGGFGLGGATRRRFALTLSVSVLNLLNNVNLAPPVATLGSPLFGRSMSLAGGPFSAQVGNPVANRLINVGASFSF